MVRQLVAAARPVVVPPLVVPAVNSRVAGPVEAAPEERSADRVMGRRALAALVLLLAE